MKKTSLNNVKTCQIATYFGRSKEGGDSETWKVGLKNNPKSGYLKLCDDPRQIIAELAAAQIGKALKLAIPTPYLAYVDRDRLPEESKWYAEGQHSMLGFVSLNAGDLSISFAALVDQKNMQILNQWKEFDNTLIFDEWLANTDRNLSNLLFDPASDKFWMIDHGRALNGPSYQINNINISANNELVNGLSDQLANDIKVKITDKAQHFLRKCSLLALDELDKDDHFIKIDPTYNKKAVQDFVDQRVFLTVELLCQKLGLHVAGIFN